MVDSRGNRVKLNIVFSLASQLIALFCGFVVPRLMINAYGSEAYGATVSISQFLAYITLLEGGIGGVARAALYKPLAQNNWYEVSSAVYEIKRFFRIIAYIFVGYSLLLACLFQYISDVQVFDWLTSFLLVIVISVSTFAQYFIGISYSVLIQAAQKTYIVQVISIVATILNTAAIVLLVFGGCDLLFVKLVSSIIFVLKPVVLWLYVKKHFHLVKVTRPNRDLLKQKWTGVGQHIAFFLHQNTDVAVLTVLTDLSLVAVYSVYNMIVAHLQNIVLSFSAGMEALFGEMLAKKEYDALHKTFGYYDMLLSLVSIVGFSVAAVLIVPFVKIYTEGVHDADYIAPTFALLLVLSALIHCLRFPYHSMTIAAGHFKQTQAAAYGEAAMNIVLSVILVWNFGLIGVAIGTLVATVFRFGYYAIYLSKNIFNRNIAFFVKREFVNAVNFLLIFFIGRYVLSFVMISNYLSWLLYALVITIVAIAITVGCNVLSYREEFFVLWNKIKNKLQKRHV